MCSTEQPASVPVDVANVAPGRAWDDIVDDVGESAGAQCRSAAEHHPWRRFARVYGADTPSFGPLGPPLSDEELLQRMTDAEALVAQLTAHQGRDLLELRRRRLDEQSRAHPDHGGPADCTHACCDPDGWVGLEVAQALAVSERVVATRIETAQRLARCAHVAAACDEGLIQSWTATKLLEHLDALSEYLGPGRLERIEAATVAWMLDRPRTVGQLNARMRRLLLAARSAAAVDRDDDGGDHDDRDPQRDAAAASAAADARERSVRVSPVEMDGLATLVARLPEQDALAVAATLRALAATPVAPDDTRTQEQRRCDLATTLVTGVPAAYGHPADLTLLAREAGQISVNVAVTIPADTLTGGSSPAEVPGYGPVGAETGRSLAGSDGATARPLVYDPQTGRLVGVGSSTRMAWLAEMSPTTGYQHPPVMERLVQLRDHTCRAPGCVRRAVRCDCDHVVPYPDGATSLANTCCLCRRHHRLKTHAPGWSVRVDESGVLTWSTPAGRALVTTPHDYSGDATPRSPGAPAVPTAPSTGSTDPPPSPPGADPAPF